MVDHCPPYKSLSEFHSIPRHELGIGFPREISKQVLVREKRYECFPLSQGYQGLCAVPDTLSVWVQVKNSFTPLPLLFGGKPKAHLGRGNELIGAYCGQAVWIWLPVALSLQTLGSMGCYRKEGNLQSSGRLSLHVGPSVGRKKSSWFVPEAQREFLSYFLPNLISHPYSYILDVLALLCKSCSNY